MKLAIVTNNELHHKYFITELYKHYNVEVIIQPKREKQGVFKTLKQKHFFMYGYLWFTLKLTSLIFNKVSSNSMQKQLKKNEDIFFSKYKKEFYSIPKDKIYTPQTVNSEEAIKIIKDNDIDIICF